MNLTSQNSTQNLFFKSDKKREFTDVLNEVQSYISSKYSALVIDGINNVNSGDDNINSRSSGTSGSICSIIVSQSKGFPKRNWSISCTRKWRNFRF